MRTPWIWLTTVLFAAACTAEAPSPSYAGQYSRASLVGDVKLTERTMAAPFAPQELAPLSLTVASALDDFEIVERAEEGGYFAVTLFPLAEGYGGQITLPTGSLDGRPLAANLAVDLEVPPSAPAAKSAEAWLTLSEPASALLVGDALQVVAVGRVERKLFGVIGEEIPDGLSEVGTASFTITATRR